MNLTAIVSNWLNPIRNAHIPPKIKERFFSIPRRLRWLVGSVILLAIVGAFAYYQYVYVPAKASAEPAVQTAVVRQGSLVLSASGTGTLISKDEVNLAFETGGEVTQVAVKVGDQVKQGDLLAAVDDTDLKLQYSQAKRALQDLTSASAIASARAGIATADEKLIAANEHLAYILSPNVVHWEGQVALAQQALEDAQAKADATPSDQTAQAALETAKAALKSAQTYLAGAQYSYEKTYVKNNFTITAVDPKTHQKVKYVAEPSQADIMDARAAVAEAQASVAEAGYLYTALTGGEIPDDATGSSLTDLEQAQLDASDAKSKLDAASLRATISGTVMSVSTSVGDTVNSGTSVITVSDLSHPYLEVYLDESDWSNVKTGGEADITFDILPDQTYKGTVTQVDPGLYTQGNSSVVRAYVQLADEGAAALDLPLGTTASVDIIGAKADNAILVPVEALHDTGSGQYTVFVMVNGKPKLRTVELGIQDLVNAVVTSGLQAGDVVTTGVTVTK